ncbi:MAG: hypothetical protein M3R25_06665 [Bacteroidota bacterium]|nr:hypothetical protein [Bacteroidota bacterium]
MNQDPTAYFTEFIEFFPALELPLSLLPDIRRIPTDSIPLPAILLEEYIYPIEGDEIDEYTEYIPYGRIEGMHPFEAVIYWKAGVMQYEFILATFTKQGLPISHAIIGGIRSDEDVILHSVAVIHEDLSITIAEAIAENEDANLARQSNTYQMSIDSSGIINYDLNEEDTEG